MDDAVKLVHTPMPPKLPARWKAIVAIVAILIGVFLPEVVAAGWHLLHGNSTRYRGWNIPVPTGWYATTRGDRLTVGKMRLFSLWRDPPTAVFLPLHAGPRYVFNYDVWQAVQTEILSKKGYQRFDARDLSLAGEPGYCWRFVHNVDVAKSWVTCVVPQEQLTADFLGDGMYIPEFYSLLEHVTRNASRN